MDSLVLSTVDQPSGTLTVLKKCAELPVKNLPANTRDRRDVLVPESGRSPGGGNGNSFLYSCLENSMDRGAWWATVHGVRKS